MGFVLDYIVKTSDKRVSSYDTLKRFIDEREQDTFGEFEDHSSSDVVMDSHDKFAEDQPLKVTTERHLCQTFINSTTRAASNTFWMVPDMFIKLEMC